MPRIGSPQLDDTPVNGETAKGITSNWAYDHNADVTKHRPVFVDRGDPSAVDFPASSFTLDAAWRDLDLLSIVGAGAIAVLLRGVFASNAVGSYIMFRKKGNSNAVNVAWQQSTVSAEQWNADMIVKLDSNGVIQYRGAFSFITFTITVGGWWI